jgi:formylglycine-generating enzyme required for sulfatase activity
MGRVPLIVIFLLVGCSLLPKRAAPPAPPDGMVYVPPGRFLMGSKPTDGVVGLEIGVDELPQHRVKLPAFYIDQYEVTVGQFRAFVEATGRPPPRIWTDPNYAPPSDDHPVVDVRWADADAYCGWAGKRLPTEAEWEKAARGDDGRLWPWGAGWEAGAANVQGDPRNWTAPVGSYPLDKSAFGVYDMAGNAMEWTSSWYEAYPGSALQRTAFGQRYKVLKGGSWMAPVHPFTHAANRYAIGPQWDHPHLGFRCAKDE